MLTFSPVELRSPLAPRASQGGLLGEGVRSAPRGRHRRRRRASEPSAFASADAEVVSAAPARAAASLGASRVARGPNMARAGDVGAIARRPGDVRGRKTRFSRAESSGSASGAGLGTRSAPHDIPMEIDRFELPDPTTKATGWEWGVMEYLCERL
jgi:hypothetical protein